MTYLLDTNTCIGFLNGRAPAVRQRLMQVANIEIAVCSIVKAELFFGSMKSTDPTGSLAKQEHFLNRFVSLPFDDQAAREFGRIRAQLSIAGTLIGPYDLQIAAIALVHGCVLVTNNTREFVRVPGLRLENWHEAP